MRRFTQSGEIEMCVRGAWKYQWQRLSVNVHDLAAGKHPAPKASESKAAESKAADTETGK
jgi:hypothetical protein